MITVGSVFYLYIDEFHKHKYFIILGEDDQNFVFATFYVNTSINYNFVENKEVENLHIVLKAEDYPFLKYDSYLNLSEYFPKNKVSLEQEYKINNECLVYTLNEEQLYFLRKVFRESSLIKGKIKKRYNFYEE